MTIRLSYQLNGYRINADVDLPEGRLRAADMLPVHREISAAVTRAVSQRVVDSGQSIACHKGCSACCKRLYVEISDAEAYRLRDVIATLPEDHRQRVTARYAAIRQQLQAAGLYQPMLDMHLGKAGSRLQLALDYYRQGIACPFLEDDACSIYPERPLACREYLVTSPAEECTRPLDGGVQRIRFPWPTTDHAMRMTRAAYDQVPLVPLVLLPSWLAQNPEPEAAAGSMELLMRAFSGLSFQLHTTADGEPPAKAAAPLASRPAPAAEPVSRLGEVVADYALPDALMVPHYGMAPISLLEDIAAAAARSIGVILLTPEPERTRAFIDSQPNPERFTMVEAVSDTAWIRDRAPIAVAGRGEGMEWYLPRLPEDGRAADASLFQTICRYPTRPSPFTMARGNLVVGPGGVALSSTICCWWKIWRARWTT